MAVRIRIKPSTFCTKLPEDPRLKTFRGQNREGGPDLISIALPHFILPPPFKSHLPGLEVKAVFARQLDILELHTIYLHRVKWFPRNPICTFYPLLCASLTLFNFPHPQNLKTIVHCVYIDQGLQFGRIKKKKPRLQL